jgi:phage terminase large subunit-like protein
MSKRGLDDNDFLDQIAPIWRPHPGQLAVLLNQAKTKVLACGRRWGKTDVSAVEVLRRICTLPRSRQIIIAPTLTQSRILFERLLQLLEDIIKRKMFTGKVKIRAGPQPKLEIGDHVVLTRSAKQGNHLRGDEATDIIVDEAAFVPDALIEDVLMPMMATTNGSLMLISTPNGRNLFYRYFELGQSEKYGVWSRRAPSSENPLVTENWLATRKELATTSGYETEFEAIFHQAQGSVFSRDAVEASLTTEKLEVIGPIIIGIDWARFRDFTAAVVLSGTRNRFNLLYADRLQNRAWENQITWVREILKRYPSARIVCDATGIGNSVTEWLRRDLGNVGVREVMITAQNKGRLVDGLVRAFETKAIRMPPYPAVIEELDNYVARTSSSGHVQMEAKSGHDDYVMSLALAVSDLPMDAGGQIILGNKRKL